MVETIDGEQFEDLYTGKFTPQEIKENLDKAKAEKQKKNQQEAEEAERLRKEEEERLKAELEKYDTDYLNDGEVKSYAMSEADRMMSEEEDASEPAESDDCEVEGGEENAHEDVTDK